MRLLYWTERFWPVIGGLETYAKQFIPAIRERGYEVAIITVRLHDHPEEEIVDGATVYRLPFDEVLRGRNPEAFVALRRRVEAIRRDFDPDLVHANLYGPSIVMHVETNKRAPVPTVVAMHCDLSETNGFGSVVQRLLDQAAWVTAVSAAALGDLKKMFPQIRDKSSFIYNGLATDGLEPTSLPTDAPHVLCFGRVVDVKGFDVAIEAFAEVRRSFPGARLTIAGDGPERPALEQQAQDLGLGDAITFPGVVHPERIYDLIGQSSVILVPSRWREPFGLVAVEAALMARPVIATRVGGLQEVVIDGETGFLVDKDDPAALARRLADVLAQPELAARLGARGRANALRRFSMETNAAAYDALYRQVLAAGEAQGGAATPANGLGLEDDELVRC